MCFKKDRDKLRLEKKSLTRVPVKWKLVIAGLIASGAGMFISSMWMPGESQNYWNNETTVPSVIRLFEVPNNRAELTPRCTNTACRSVTCFSIPESADPGKFASDFLNQTFRAQCPSTSSIQELTFEYCNFANGELGRNWLATELRVEKLAFRDCGLETFTEGSFSSKIFTNLESLSVSTGKIKSLRKTTFDELKNLKNLLMYDNIVHEADSNLLSSVADSLEILVLDACIKNARVLQNITISAGLSKVQIFSSQRNIIGRVTGELLKSMPNIVSVYLAKSNIESMDVDSLKNSRSLKFLDVKDNLLEKLPFGVLAPVFPKNPDFAMSLSNNPWNCSCDFKWMGDFARDNPGTLSEIPKCEAPARNALKYFTHAQFCEDSELVYSTTTEKIISESDIPDPEYVRFTCQNFEETKHLIEEWKFPSRSRGFSVKTLAQDQVSVELRANGPRVSLVWFKNDELDSAESSTQKINCLRNVASSIILRDLDSNSSYTVCLLENLEERPSPLNCLASRTMSVPADAESNNNNKDDVWLTSEDKSVVIAASIGLLVLVSLLSSVSCFFLIRRNPSLLRGSERVVIVKKRKIEALVMPKGNSRSAEESKCEERLYLSPAENPCSRARNPSPRYWMRRRDSKASRVSSQYSAGSYISGIEPTPSELYNWRNMMRMRTLRDACMENEEFEESVESPQLSRSRSFEPVVPSLSFSVDSKDSNLGCCDQTKIGFLM